MRLRRAAAILALTFLAGCGSLNKASKEGQEFKSQPSKEDTAMIEKAIKSDKEWKSILTLEQYRIMRKGGTERAFSGKYNDHYEKGIYVCAGCGNPLFRSEAKYDHGTGWPSFSAAVDESHIDFREDDSLSIKRMEVRCAVCGAHLGHIFDDGPEPTYKHYCINSAVLDFKPAGSELSRPSELQKVPETEVAIFAGGCFWGVEDKFRQIKGVLSTTVGYTGGQVKTPSYKQVCSDTTGHAEAVQITFDPSQVSYEELLKFFFNIHDPTQLNRQGPDVGTQYRSVIFYLSEEQRKAAKKMIEHLGKSGRFKKPIVTEIVPASEFYKAEEYHQKYIEKRSKRK